jgi:hypothetical protein
MADKMRSERSLLAWDDERYAQLEKAVEAMPIEDVDRELETLGYDVKGIAAAKREILARQARPASEGVAGNVAAGAGRVAPHVTATENMLALRASELDRQAKRSAKTPRRMSDVGVRNRFRSGWRTHLVAAGVGAAVVIMAVTALMIVPRVPHDQLATPPQPAKEQFAHSKNPPQTDLNELVKKHMDSSAMEGALRLDRPIAGSIRILESDVAGLNVGRVLPPHARLLVPSYHSLRVFETNGRMRVIKGPYDGLVGEMTDSAREIDKVAWDRMGTELSKQLLQSFPARGQ